MTSLAPFSPLPNFTLGRFPLRLSALAWALALLALAWASPAAGADGRDKLSLNGIWDFYPENGSTRYDIKVPAYWDETTSNGHPSSWASLGYAVYRKSFTIPDSMAGKEIFLNIGALTVLGKVFFNGTRVGGESTGNYLQMMLPYSIDVTPYANVGGNNNVEVHVYARSRFPSDSMNGSRYLYPFGTDMLVGRRGICGDVNIMACPKVYIADVQVITDLKKNADPSDDTISLNVTLANKSGAGQSVTLRNAASLVGGSVEKAFLDQDVTVNSGATQTVTISNVAWTNASYWWPTDPKLYSLVSDLVQGPTTLDTVTNRFGLRQFYAKANTNYFELNGVRCNLRGDNIDNLNANGRWGDANDASIAYAVKLLDEWKAINLNVVRNCVVSYVNDEVFDHCDEIGMMVIDEPPYWQSYQQGLDGGATALNYIDKYMVQWVKSRKNHPSIIMYSSANEEEASPLAMLTQRRTSILSYDSTRPIENDGTQKETLDDEVNYHYTSLAGNWDPIDPVRQTSLYSIFPNNGTTRPRGEGECLWACADGYYPALDAAGRISGQCELDGSTPDAVTYAVWARQCGRACRGARYQGIADYRSFMNVYHAFEWIEGPIIPTWSDLSAPGLKPVVMVNRCYNPFDTNYPAVIHGDAYDYYKNSFAPVAAFDKACDAANVIGATAAIYTGGANLTRTIVVYNDEFSGGSSLTVGWAASYQEPGGAGNTFATGSFDITVSYGQRGSQAINFVVPSAISANKILNLELTVTKNSAQRFRETNQLGYINGAPAAKLYISNPFIDLGPIRSQAGLLHKIKLINIGGGASESWVASGYRDWLRLNWTSGNLRREQEIFYTVDTSKLGQRTNSTTVTFTGSHGTTAQATIMITGNGSNSAPVASAQWVVVQKETAKAFTLTGSDIDGDPLTYWIVTAPAHGTLSGTAPDLTYTPAAGYTGMDSFTFKVNDGAIDSAVATVNLMTTSGSVVCTGGTMAHYTLNGVEHAVHTFTNDGTLNVVNGGLVEVLVVGGGGGTGSQCSGAGAGGFYYTTNFPVVSGNSINVLVGAGGIAGPNTGGYVYSAGGTGGTSQFDLLLAYGGLPGGSYDAGGNQGGYSLDGGITVIPGNLGGTHVFDGNYASGGGAGGPGVAVNNSAGGAGLANSITGASLYYAGGGGVGSGPGGSGIGGHGADGNRTQLQMSGTNGRGGGAGGGWGGNSWTGGAPGGSGIVIVAYSTVPVLTGVTSSGGTLTITGASTATAVTLYQSPVASAPITDWTPVQTNSVSGGTFSFTVTPGAGPGAGFYRVGPPGHPAGP